MRVFLTILVVFCYQFVQGQSYFLQDGVTNFDSTNSILIQLGAQRVDQSNAISREMLDKFFFGGSISEESKRQVRDRLKGQNFYGGELTPDISFTLFKPDGKFGWNLSYSYRNLNSLEFTDDLFTVIFYGNSEFAESPANLGKSTLNIFNYQSLSFGMIDRQTGTNFKIGIYDNRNYSNVEIQNTTLSTDFIQSGDYNIAEEISLQAGNYTSRLATGQNLFDSGIGFGLSGEYFFSIDKSRFILGVEDFGLMYLKNLQKSDTSGVFEYSGFDWNIGDGAPLNDVFNTFEDSLKPSISQVDEWVMLPAKFKVSYISPRFGNFYFRADASHRIQMGYKPELAIAVNYTTNGKNSFWLRPTIGGYSDFSMGMGAQLGIFENTILTIGSNHLFGIISANGRATSLFVNLIKRI